MKAAGSDGFLTIFFQKFWHMFGRDVSTYCLEILNEGMSLESHNVTNMYSYQNSLSL